MKRRWKIILGVTGGLLAALAAPIIYVEAACGPGGDHPFGGDFASTLPAADHRPEARSWLTYPEWHIVHAADSYGRHLSAGRAPSTYPFWSDVRGFWRSTCAVNRITSGREGASDAKVMIYTIGVSFTAEMAIKWLWEETIGHLFEAIDGHDSQNDRIAARVQRDYGAFMHQVPWYEFPFGKALGDTWRYRTDHDPVRHWERRIAMSMEYGVKAIYAGLIGWASDATLGPDQLTLRFTTPAAPAQLTALDPRLKPFGTAANGQTIVEAPRYAEFNELLGMMAGANIPLSDIAGNDDIFLTVQAPAGTALPGDTLFTMPLGDRPGWQRFGLTVKVSALSATLPAIQRAGGEVEHVHDY